jgi:HEAT repeat protein
MERDTSRSRARWLLAPLTVALLGLGGCAFIDEPKATVIDLWHWNFERFRDPDNPLEVVRNSKDGNLRARALRCLKEPLTNGGTKEDQDVIVAVLVYSAGNDSQALCRMAAIDVLRKFHDPRAVDGLKDAYYRAGSFNAEVATVLRCQALQGLGETGQQAAVETLVRVLREPPVEGPDQDRQLKLDERIAAARALGNFKQYQATAALVDVLRKEQDVALRARAHESLVFVTGRELPPDATVWAEFLNNPNSKEVLAQERSWTDRVLQLTGLK